MHIDDHAESTGGTTKMPENRLMLLAQKARLLTLRLQTEQLFDGLEQGLRLSYQDVKRTGETVDVAGTAALIALDLGKIIRQGFMAMKFSGTALEEANRELSKEAMKFSTGPLQDVALETAAHRINANQGLIWAFGKSVIEAYLDLTTPSFWASTCSNLRSGMRWSQAVTTTPEDLMDSGIARLEFQKRQALAQLDHKIREIERRMNGRTEAPRRTIVPVSTAQSRG
jgi:hypothetical protein